MLENLLEYYRKSEIAAWKREKGNWRRGEKGMGRK